MTTRILLASLLIAFASAGPVGAAGALCGPRDDVVGQLEARHGEARQSVGLQRNSRVMEIYANAETGTWTVIVTLPNGVSCLVAAGEAYQSETGSVATLTSDDPA